MEPNEKPSESQKIKTPVSAAPPVVAQGPSRVKLWLARTGTSFTAEYTMFLILLGVSLSNLVSLVYIFFGLVVDAMNGTAVSSFVPVHLFSLWLLVSSVVTLPLAYMLWSRVQGELTANKEFNGVVPKGAARGFRTVWLIVSVLSAAGMLMLAVYAPLAAALSGGMGAQLLLSVTLPSLVSIAVTGAGIYLVTRTQHNRKRALLLLAVVAALTLVLFIVDYVWASNNKVTTDRAPSYTRPSDYDAYDDMYNDPYYDYELPSDYR